MTLSSLLQVQALFMSVVAAYMMSTFNSLSNKELKKPNTLYKTDFVQNNFVQL